MKKAINDHGWDNEWFIRAYDHFGEKVGSKEQKEGKIFIESQGMCVMAGIGLDDGRALQTLDSVKKYLDCDYGIVLNNPAFRDLSFPNEVIQKINSSLSLINSLSYKIFDISFRVAPRGITTDTLSLY